MKIKIGISIQILNKKNHYSSLMAILEDLDGYEPKKAKESLTVLLVDRRNEFKELAVGMGIPTTSKNWEQTILKFCLDFNECFYVITRPEGPNDQTEDKIGRAHV